MNWDDARIFLAVARHGGFAAAAARLGLDHTTVARRLTGLERAIGEPLINRSPRGARLTDAGQSFLGHAERMESEAIAASERFGAGGAQASGVVRLATPEAFGAYLVAPAAHRLFSDHPGIELELVPEARAVNLSKREADLAVSLTRPQNSRLVVQKLADYQLGLYAAVDYLENAGPVTDLASISQRPLVWYIDELIDVPELRFFDQYASGGSSVFRSSSIVAQQNAVAAGLGLGFLHCFAADRDPRLVRLLADEICIERTYWLVLHADLRDLPRIRAVSDFIRQLARAAL